MNSILFVLVKPHENDKLSTSQWSTVTSIVEGDATTNKGVQILNRGTYLIHASDGLPFLGLAIHQADQKTVQYRVFFFETTAEMPPQRET